ncbi:MAG: glucose-6-phosphate dehydrogenase [Nitrospirota bacterium]
MATEKPDAIVVFGVSGDLAQKKIIPALYALVCRGYFKGPVIGVAKRERTPEQIRAMVRESLESHGGVNPQTFASLIESIHYVGGDYRDPATFTRLRKALGSVARPLYYLAIQPSLFTTVIEGLAKLSVVDGARMIVEKPFGRNLASAEALNRMLHNYFPDQAIFRIDHYLGKESVQNLVYFRFANPIFETGWNRHSIQRVQITMAEQFGVAGRGRFYEEVGAIRDVVQNHLLMLIACLAMEQPPDRDTESIREERVKVLKMIRPLTPSDVVRGQFNGYRLENGVAYDSQVETFAALRFYIDSERWAGVPFYVRTGKCLPVTATEVLVEYKRPSSRVLGETEPPLPNYFRFRLSPDMIIALGTKAKVPGEALVGERIELVARQCSGDEDEMDPYERLLGDAMKGDAALFARGDGVEAAWRIIQPILETPMFLYEYEPNTWGPREADRLIECGWHNPQMSG